MHRGKAPEIVKTHDVISVRMGVHDCIDSGDILPQSLNAKFGAGIDDPAEIVSLNIDGGTHPIISRILRPADRTIAAKRRDSHRCARAEESDRKHGFCVSLGQQLGVEKKPPHIYIIALCPQRFDRFEFEILL
jgi:hypothetical protein